MTEKLSGITGTARTLFESYQAGDSAAVDRLVAILPSLRKVAESGEVAAQDLVGGILLEIEENPSDAASWFRKSAERGSAVGKRSLGHLYANGLGVAQDLAQAERLFHEAAGQGDAYAQFNLAQLWWGKRAPEEVAALLRSAAEGGVDDAHVVLGDLLAAMDQDVEALRWFFVMLKEGNADRLREAIDLARGMTDEDIRLAGSKAGTPGEAEALVGTVAKYR
ncbi:tetratricopeptide repeat protein [Streptomyces sp. NPDC090119]|uniref:tetratricopeptide repeat protein n=1 Tax=Streptomyces sp. NPDC090119 TaxID=3365951 RepID=UPI0037F852A9